MEDIHHDIILVQCVDACSNKGIDSHLSGDGFNISCITDLEELESMCEKLNNPVVILECGFKEADCVAAKEKISAMPHLHSVPQILVGRFASRLKKDMELYFKMGYTVDIPYEVSEVSALLNEIFPLYDDYLEQLQEEESVRSSETPDGLRCLIQAGLSDYNLFSTSVSGDQYKSSIDEFYLEEGGYLPSDPRYFDIAAEVLTGCSDRTRLHLCRVSFVHQQITRALGYEGSMFEMKTKAAPFALAWEAYKPTSEILRFNYLDSDKRVLRDEMLISFKIGAHRIEKEINEKDFSQYMLKVVELITDSGRPEDDEDYILASSLIISELADRICFYRGFWNSHFAYHFIKRLNTGDMSHLHPAVLSCMVKFLSEKCLAVPDQYLLKKKKSEGDSEESFRELPEELQDNEQNVAMGDLAPGMKLSRPIFSYDGKEMLEAGVELDQDLICRIWSICSMRPFSSGVVVINDD